MTATLIEAGHILDSAAVSLQIEENGKKHRLWFSGDIGRRNLPLIRNPVLPSDVDTLIMECTYGNRSHEIRWLRWMSCAGYYHAPSNAAAR